eukprot:Pgem_evm1s12734
MLTMTNPDFSSNSEHVDIICNTWKTTQEYRKMRTKITEITIGNELIDIITPPTLTIATIANNNVHTTTTYTNTNTNTNNNNLTKQLSQSQKVIRYVREVTLEIGTLINRTLTDYRRDPVSYLARLPLLFILSIFLATNFISYIGFGQNEVLNVWSYLTWEL